MNKICKVVAFQINSLGNFAATIRQTKIYFCEPNWRQPQTWPSWEDVRQVLQKVHGQKIHSFDYYMEWEII